MAVTDKQIFDWIRNSVGYRDLNVTDRNKVQKALEGQPSTRPASNLGQAAWHLAKRLAPVAPPPPPPDPVTKLAARTYNKVLPDGSDARFCKQSPGVVVHTDGSFSDHGNHYDTNGLHLSGPRDPNYQVPGLRQANNMNGMDPCTLYDGMTQWPKESYA